MTTGWRRHPMFADCHGRWQPHRCVAAREPAQAIDPLLAHRERPCRHRRRSAPGCLWPRQIARSRLPSGWTSREQAARHGRRRCRQKARCRPRRTNHGPGTGSARCPCRRKSSRPESLRPVCRTRCRARGSSCRGYRRRGRAPLPHRRPRVRQHGYRWRPPRRRRCALRH
ncbi:hypothetical protein D3C87_1598340 [compost metagenome]